MFAQVVVTGTGYTPPSPSKLQDTRLLIMLQNKVQVASRKSQVTRHKLHQLQVTPATSYTSYKLQPRLSREVLG